MKYNRSIIMKRAWEIKNNYHSRSLTFGECLSRAWDEAKTAAAENSYVGCKFVNGMEIVMDGVTRTLNRWTKHGKDRVYINNNRKNDGYVDLTSGSVWLSNDYRYLSKIAGAIKTMVF